MKGKKNKKRRVFDSIRILVLLVAFSVLLYPTVSNYLYEKKSTKVVAYYDENVETLEEKEKETIIKKAEEYNKKLAKGTSISDPFSTVKGEMDGTYKNLLNINGAGMMGYITIPKIKVELPIYHGTTEEVLQAGVGHFEGTSLPVGGTSTHTVLTGHRGLPSKKLFTDLDQLGIGDIFYIKILDQTLAYQVDQIVTVKPEQTDGLSVVKGKDYATLVTCTPYAVNTHRLLIRGHRIPYEEAIEQVEDEVKVALPFEIKVLIGALLLLVSIFLTSWIVKRKRDKKSDRREKHEKK